MCVCVCSNVGFFLMLSIFNGCVLTWRTSFSWLLSLSICETLRCPAAWHIMCWKYFCFYIQAPNISVPSCLWAMLMLMWLCVFVHACVAGSEMSSILGRNALDIQMKRVLTGLKKLVNFWLGSTHDLQVFVFCFFLFEACHQKCYRIRAQLRGWLKKCFL